MDASEAVRTKLDVREFSSRHVSNSIKLEVLQAGRLTQSGANSQHWRFILVQEPASLQKLAAASSTGGWVSRSDFAVVICTDPGKGYHLIDCGRAAQDMQLTAWDHGVASGVYTGIKQAEMKRDFGIPDPLSAVIVVAFGFPARKLLGKKKDRVPLEDISYLEKFGGSLDPLTRGS